MTHHLYRKIIISLFSIAAIIGLSRRFTYSDIRKDDDFLQALAVAELPGDIAERTMKDSLKELNSCPVIMRVQAEGDMEYIFGTAKQKVYVDKIYKGNNLTVGEEIYLTTDRWCLSLVAEPESVECGYVNIPDDGKKYIVFSEGIADTLYDKIPVYRLYEETLFTPVFGLDEKVNTIIPVKGESTYVPYSKVANNEFFTDSENGLSAWNSIKEIIMEQYR